MTFYDTVVKFADCGALKTASGTAGTVIEVAPEAFVGETSSFSATADS